MVLHFGINRMREIKFCPIKSCGKVLVFTNSNGWVCPIHDKEIVEKEYYGKGVNIMTEEMDSTVGEKEMTEAMGGEVGEAVRKLKEIKEIECHGICFRKTSTTDIRGYPHSGGLKDKDGNKWWVYVHCNNPIKHANRLCNYETSCRHIRELGED